MERIKKWSLKKSLFIIALANSTAALFLSAVFVWGCVELNSMIAPQGVSIEAHSGLITVTKLPEPTAEAVKTANLISFFQFLLPVLFYTSALLSTASMFYRLKLKEPLKILSDGASRIIDNDLDFIIDSKSQDELGQLCMAFETMRRTLFEVNRELWRQAEERKRLNSAFSHNLRNPVTVLKGSVKLARQKILSGAEARQLTDDLSLIGDYTDRIEQYIETMSSVQRLEEIPIVRESADYDSICSELKRMIHFIGMSSDKQLHFEADAYPHPILTDRAILFQIAENLVSNAIRFARQHIDIHCSIKEDLFVFSVADDGCGFPAGLLKNGIRPFQKGNEESEHFGMGLYTSRLLAERHGGTVSVRNGRVGAVVLAELKIKDS